MNVDELGHRLNNAILEALLSDLKDSLADRDSWMEQAHQRVKDWDDMRLRAEKAEAALAQNAQGEPVYLFRRKGLDDFVTCSRERFDELGNKPYLFETRILYTHAERASVPDVPAIMAHLPDNRAATRCEMFRALALAAAPSQPEDAA